MKRLRFCVMVGYMFVKDVKVRGGPRRTPDPAVTGRMRCKDGGSLVLDIV